MSGCRNRLNSTKPSAPARSNRSAISPVELEVYGDSAYGSGQARADYRDAGHDTVIKPGPVRPAVDDGFTIDDFTVDEERGSVTCPAGQVRHMNSKVHGRLRLAGGCRHRRPR
jgi:hypothetical protein